MMKMSFSLINSVLQILLIAERWQIKISISKNSFLSTETQKKKKRKPGASMATQTCATQFRTNGRVCCKKFTSHWQMPPIDAIWHQDIINSIPAQV